MIGLVLLCITLIIIILCFGFYYFKTVEKYTEILYKHCGKKSKIKSLNKILSFLTKEVAGLTSDRKEMMTTLHNLYEERDQTKQELQQLQNDFNQRKIEIENQKNNSLFELEEIKKNNEILKQANNRYLEVLDQDLIKKEQEYDERINSLEQQYALRQQQLSQVKNTLTVAAQKALKEREEKEQQDFYRIVLSSKDKTDIDFLNSIKEKISQPEILSKLIWNTYIQKKANDLCTRVVDGDKSGIYKITNLQTQQHYIGQSVNISNRFIQHIKCGLGIGATANKLYQSMLEYGIDNFSFEVLEYCSKDLLNEKERTWIDIYSSHIYGLNSNTGVKK